MSRRRMFNTIIPSSVPFDKLQAAQECNIEMSRCTLLRLTRHEEMPTTLLQTKAR